MSTLSDRFHDALSRWFHAGAVYTFVGAGGKTTAMKRVASVLAESGMKARLTTTTRVGIDEFAGFSVCEVHGPADLERAVRDDATVRLLVGGSAPDKAKYLGLDPRLLEGLALAADTVLLVEGDGSRKRPIKAPNAHEPVIPSNTTTVFAVMGASAFDEPIDEAHCYNHEAAVSLARGVVFGSREVAALAGDPGGSCKGVLSGMAFRLLLNQCDLDQKRTTASLALRMAKEKYGIRGALVSFQEGELYETTDE